MKALSLTQPWAWLVVNGGKNIENRRWNTNLRGEFLIHASKKMTERDYFAAALALDQLSGAQVSVAQMPPFHELKLGGIVGLANLVHVFEPDENRRPWSADGQYGFVLEDVSATPFIPCRGMLNFWEVPVEVLAALAAAEGRR